MVTPQNIPGSYVTVKLKLFFFYVCDIRVIVGKRNKMMEGIWYFI